MATFQVKQPTFQQQQQTTTRKSPLELLIAQQAMAQKADAKTLAGFAFGKLLRGIFDDWKERYTANGDLEALDKLKDAYGDWFSTGAPPDRQQVPAPITTQPIQPTQSTQSTQPALPQINADWLKTDNKPWENIDNWKKWTGLDNTQKLLGDSDSLVQRAILTDEPFKLVGDNDYFNPSQWNNFDDALKIFQTRRGW